MFDVGVVSICIYTAFIFYRNTSTRTHIFTLGNQPRPDGGGSALAQARGTRANEMQAKSADQYYKLQAQKHGICSKKKSCGGTPAGGVKSVYCHYKAPNANRWTHTYYKHYIPFVVPVDSTDPPESHPANGESSSGGLGRPRRIGVFSCIPPLQ